jgi:hypothetical protein
LKPTDIATTVKCQPGYEAKLASACAGLDRFQRFAKFVRDNPINELTAGGSVYTKLNLMVGGKYQSDRHTTPATTAIWLNLDSEVGAKLMKMLDGPATLGVIGNVNRLLSGTEFYTATLVHELSHHVTFKCLYESAYAGDDTLFQKFVALSVHAGKNGKVVSAYGMQDGPEWFAETLTAYLFFPEQLKALDSASYKAMKDLGL